MSDQTQENKREGMDRNREARDVDEQQLIREAEKSAEQKEQSGQSGNQAEQSRSSS